MPAVLAARTTGPERRWRLGLLVVLLLATATRVAMILVTPHWTLWGDPSDYQIHAISVAAGHGYPTTTIASPGTPSAFRPPGYPYALGGLYALVGVHPQAGRALSALLGVLTVGLVAALGRALAGRRVGLLAGAIAAVFLPLIALNASLVSEALFLPLELAFALAALALARGEGRRRTRWALATGALCALTVLTRAGAELWLLVALAAALAAGGSAATRWRTVGAVVASFALVLAPWTIRNFIELHALVPVTTETGYTLAGQYNDETAAPNDFDAVWQLPLQVPSIARQVSPLYRRRGGVNEAQLDSALRRIALNYLRHHPGRLAIATGLDTLRLLDLGPGHTFTTAIAYRELALPQWLREPVTLSAQLVTALAVLALLAAGVRRRRLPLGPWWLWGIPLLTLAVTIPMVGNPLKRAPLDPFLIVLAAAGLAALAASRMRHT
jgi:4-amino-4-deoxy-L-arabinose transferase-like glycosyltransferase